MFEGNNNMNQFNLKDHLLSFYLAIVLLLIVPLSVWSYVQVLIPLFIISLGIHLKEKNIGFIGITLFFLFSLTQITIKSLDQIMLLFVFSFVVLLPSVLLLSQLLYELNAKQLFHIVHQKKKQIAFTIFLALCFLLTVYLIATIIGERLLFDTTMVQGQILLISGVSFLFFIPILLKNTGFNTVEST